MARPVWLVSLAPDRQDPATIKKKLERGMCGLVQCKDIDKQVVSRTFWVYDLNVNADAPRET